MMRTARRHAFQPDTSATDWRGQPGCAVCPLPKDHEIHDLPPTDPAVVEAEARRLGESDN